MISGLVYTNSLYRNIENVDDVRYIRAMLPSELAHELRMDQSAMSKLLKRYFLESGGHREATLPPEVIAHVREVQRLVTTGEAATIPQAVQKVLGTYIDPIPPASAQMMLQSITELRTCVNEALDRLTRIEVAVARIDEYVARAQARQAAQLGHDRSNSPS